jgi:membrane dipeptidase
MISIDGLHAGRVDREILEDLRHGELTAVTVTLGFWEDATETMDNIARWRDVAEENADIIRIVDDPAEIEQAAEEGRTAVILGLQNTAALQDRIRFVDLFARMGIRVMQLTYNNQNAVGGSCYEAVDPGLSRYGRQLVRELNRSGILIDLSHVGERTSREAIEASERPVAITHANPHFLYEHARNKTRPTLDALAERGGVLGLATYPNITGEWGESPQRWAEMVERTVEAIGIDHVGIGTDLAPKIDETEYAWMRMGRWSRDAQYGAGRPGGPVVVAWPQWSDSPAKFQAFAEGLRDRGFAPEHVEAIMGGNFLRLYKETMATARWAGVS